MTENTKSSTASLADQRQEVTMEDEQYFAGGESPRLFAVLTTYQRHTVLPESVGRVLSQTRAPDVLVVVDNESSAATRALIEEIAAQQRNSRVRYLSAGDNLGPAGGWALGMESCLEEAQPNDWILTLDDNNPPKFADEVEKMFVFAIEQHARNLRVAGVGAVGAKFSWRAGVPRRVPTEDLHGAVEVDYLGGGQLSMYRAATIQEFGVMARELFFGSVEVEYGLRLRRAGLMLLAHGDLWRERRMATGRDKLQVKASGVCVIHWKKYYRIRNYIYTMIQLGRWDLSLRWAIIQCLLKPLWTVFSSPRLAVAGFLQAYRASRDGFLGRMGRTVEPNVIEDSIPSTFDRCESQG